MAKYLFTHACGHEARVEVKAADAVAIERNYVERTLCRECFYSDERSLADVAERTFTLPELAGSAAQIQWARSIRAKARLLVDDALEILGDKDAAYLGWHPVGLVVETKAVLDWLFARHSESKFWIDHRHFDGFALINLALFHCVTVCLCLDTGECSTCGAEHVQAYKLEEQMATNGQ